MENRLDQLNTFRNLMGKGTSFPNTALFNWQQFSARKQAYSLKIRLKKSTTTDWLQSSPKWLRDISSFYNLKILESIESEIDALTNQLENKIFMIGSLLR